LENCKWENLIGVSVAEKYRHLTENKDLKRCGFNPQQPMRTILQPRIAKKINYAPSVRVIVICSDHRLLWRDSYKDVDPALTSDESIMYEIFIIQPFSRILHYIKTLSAYCQP